MSAHTPGPWLADDEGVGGSHDRHGHWFGVGPMGDAMGRGHDVALVEKKEDARLIAQAPRLYALAKSLDAFAQLHTDNASDFVIEARAILAAIDGSAR